MGASSSNVDDQTDIREVGDDWESAGVMLMTGRHQRGR